MRDIGSSAHVLFMGHTSLDVATLLTADLAPINLNSGSSSRMSALNSEKLPDESVVDDFALQKSDAFRDAVSAGSISADNGSPSKSTPEVSNGWHDEDQAPERPCKTASCELRAGHRRFNGDVAVLHAKGRSGLKHTRELLRCWLSRPDLPHLTIAGKVNYSCLLPIIVSASALLLLCCSSPGRVTVSALHTLLPMLILCMGFTIP